MAAILASKYPHKTMELMMYLCTIMKAHRSFVGDGWITYDMAYWRKATVSKSLDWSQADFTLYNETFTGRVKSIVRCGYCLSESYSSQECGYAPGDSTVNQNRTPRYNRPSISFCGHFNSSNGINAGSGLQVFTLLCKIPWPTSSVWVPPKGPSFTQALPTEQSSGKV